MSVPGNASHARRRIAHAEELHSTAPQPRLCHLPDSASKTRSASLGATVEQQDAEMGGGTCASGGL
eukprot:946840-Rhodomonas_salina.2